MCVCVCFNHFEVKLRGVFSFMDITAEGACRSALLSISESIVG